MNDFDVPAPIVPQNWDEIDTSIDDESPHVLSDEQFERYCTTVRDLLVAAGLDVQDLGRARSRAVNVHDIRTLDIDDGPNMQVTLAHDRIANVEITFDEDSGEPFTTVQLVGHLLRLLELARSFDRARAELT